MFLGGQKFHEEKGELVWKPSFFSVRKIVPFVFLLVMIVPTFGSIILDGDYFIALPIFFFFVIVMGGSFLASNTQSLAVYTRGLQIPIRRGKQKAGTEFVKWEDIEEMDFARKQGISAIMPIRLFIKTTKGRTKTAHISGFQKFEEAIANVGKSLLLRESNDVRLVMGNEVIRLKPKNVDSNLFGRKDY